MKKILNNTINIDHLLHKFNHFSVDSYKFKVRWSEIVIIPAIPEKKLINSRCCRLVLNTFKNRSFRLNENDCIEILKIKYICRSWNSANVSVIPLFLAPKMQPGSLMCQYLPEKENGMILDTHMACCSRSADNKSQPFKFITLRRR